MTLALSVARVNQSRSEPRSGFQNFSIHKLEQSIIAF